jgi:hypothetical protein
MYKYLRKCELSNLAQEKVIHNFLSFKGIYSVIKNFLAYNSCTGG